MPLRRKRNATYRRKRRKPWRKSNFGRPSRPMRQSVYMFKRRIQEVTQVNDLTTSNWVAEGNGIIRHWNFSLADLTNSNDFINLFSSYKITGVKVEIYFSNNLANANLNQQMIGYAAPNRSGQVAHGLTEQYFLECQASTKRACYVDSARPLTYFMKVNQLSEQYNSITNTDYAFVKPKYISTLEPNAAHYGLDTRIQCVNNTAMPLAFIKCILTYYITCKGVE